MVIDYVFNRFMYSVFKKIPITHGLKHLKYALDTQSLTVNIYQTQYTLY